MTVVLPQPLAPTIIVSGVWNSMACSRSGLKARMPRMASFSMQAMLCVLCLCASARRVSRVRAGDGSAVVCA